MKKILSVLLLSACVSVVMAAHAGGLKYDNTGIDKNVKATDTWAVTLGPCKGDTTYDTLDAAAAPNFYVFNLCQNATRPMAKYMATMARAGAIRTSGDSVSIAYQILQSLNLADTVATGWTVMDTVTSTGKNGAVVDLSAKVGIGIVFKITNIDATGIAIVKPIKIVFKEPAQTAAPVR